MYRAHGLHEVTELSSDGPIPLTDITAINVEPVHLTGTVTMGGNSTTGNSRAKAFNGATRLTLHAHRQRFIMEGKYNYGQADDQVTARNSMASLKHDYFVTKHVFIESFGMLEKDTCRICSFATRSAAASGYQFYESARTTLALAVGLAYVNEHFTNSPSTDPVRTLESAMGTFRWAGPRQGVPPP